MGIANDAIFLTIDSVQSDKTLADFTFFHDILRKAFTVEMGFMSDDKLDQILLKLAELEKSQTAGFAALEKRQVALEERQKADFGMIAGALDTQNENIRTVDSSVALVNVAVKENSKVIAQLRAEHGGYLRSIQMATEALDRRVTVLEGRP